MASWIKDILSYFSNAGEYTDIVAPMEESPIRNAIKENKIKSVKDMLLRKQFNLEEELNPFTGHTFIHETICLNKRDIFTLAMLYGADVNKPDIKGNTPLIKAAALGRYWMVSELLARGADPNIKNMQGQTAKDKAILFDRFHIIELLEGKEINQKYMKY